MTDSPFQPAESQHVLDARRDIFAEANSLNVSKEGFYVETLSDKVHEWRTSICYNHYVSCLEHPDYFVCDFGCPRVMTAQPYMPIERLEPLLLKMAHEYSVRIHFAPEGVRGWYQPDKTTLIAITRPGVELNWSGSKHYVLKT